MTIDVGKVVGDSAYEVAVSEGYIGTKAEWLESLKGPNVVSTTTDTTISGLLKGSNGKVAQAVAGTDYLVQHQDISGKANVGDSYTKAESDAKYITQHQSLAEYRKASQQDVIDQGKQAVISDLATIRSGAALGATALQSVPNTYRTSAAQDVIDATKANASDVYTKTQTDSAISAHHDATKADVSTTYTKSEVDTAIAGHHDATKQDKIDASHKLSYNLLSDTPAIPTKTSDLTNDSGFLTQHQSLSAYRTSAAQDVIDATKQDALPTVVNDRYLHTNAATGSLEWAEVQGGGRGQIETYSVQSWTDLANASPYKKQASVTAVHTIASSTLVELINNDAVSFATYGFAVGAVSGQSVTIYAVSAPSSQVSLTIQYTD